MKRFLKRHPEFQKFWKNQLTKKIKKNIPSIETQLSRTNSLNSQTPFKIILSRIEFFKGFPLRSLAL